MDLNLFLTILSTAISIAGFVVAIVTLLNTGKIKTAVTGYQEKELYVTEIDTIIKDLESIHISIKEDDLYNQKVLNNVLEILDKITIQYESVVKPFLKTINKLRTKIAEAEKSGEAYYNKKEITRLLKQIIEYLEKERKTL